MSSPWTHYNNLILLKFNLSNALYEKSSLFLWTVYVWMCKYRKNNWNTYYVYHVFHLVFHTLVLIYMDCNSIHTKVNVECLFSYSSKRKEHDSSSYLPKLRTTFLPLLMHFVWNDYKLVQKWSINQHCGSRSSRYSWWCGGIQGRESISPMDQQSWNSNLCEPFVWGC